MRDDFRMNHNVRIVTHESIVHGQISAIESLLKRSVNFAITLNVKGVRSNLSFEASAEEIEKVRSDLGYNVYLQGGEEWVPVNDRDNTP